jgi:hypothetical protein
MAGYPGLADLLRALMAEAQIDREFGDRFRAAFLERRPDSPPASCSAPTGTGP